MTRVALIGDYLEDHWYSMDLVAEMLLSQLASQYGGVYRTTLIRPAMKIRFRAIPFLRGQNGTTKADQAINRFFEYPRHLHARRKDFEIFHVVDHSYAQLVHGLPAERTILACHDLEAFRCLTEPQVEHRSRFFRAMTQRILSGFQKAAKVVCSSAATRTEVLHFGLVPPERITVAPLAVDPIFSPIRDAAADAEVQSLLGSENGSFVDIVHVGSTVARKRIDILLRVFSEVKKRVPHARLLRIGGRFTEEQAALANRLNVSGSTTVLPFLDKRGLAAIYRRASVVLQPSEREGFGLPVIEAMASGVPVIASDIPVLREVGGSASRYCPLEDIPAWCNRVLETLSQSAPERALVRSAGIEQASKFTWSAYAAACAQLYGELLSAHS